jgi:hypothetical protein
MGRWPKQHLHVLPAAVAIRLVIDIEASAAWGGI